MSGIPFGLMFRNYLALGVIPDHQGRKIAHDVQLFRTESCCHCEWGELEMWERLKMSEWSCGLRRKWAFLFGISVDMSLDISDSVDETNRAQMQCINSHINWITWTIIRVPFSIPSSNIDIYERLLSLHLLPSGPIRQVDKPTIQQSHKTKPDQTSKDGS